MRTYKTSDLPQDCQQVLMDLMKQDAPLPELVPLSEIDLMDLADAIDSELYNWGEEDFIRAARYAFCLIASPEGFPPILCDMRELPELRIRDGYHRAVACRIVGRAKVPFINLQQIDEEVIA